MRLRERRLWGRLKAAALSGAWLCFRVLLRARIGVRRPLSRNRPPHDPIENVHGMRESVCVSEQHAR